MQEIIFCKGLPGSGKSTWAKQFCKENPDYIRLNKDDLREMLGDPPFNRDFENAVLSIQRKMGETVLATGKSIIIDDTNFAQKHWDYWLGVANRLHLNITQRLFDTSVEVCIERDSERVKSVGKEVILSMYEKYVKPYETENKKPISYE